MNYSEIRTLRGKLVLDKQLFRGDYNIYNEEHESGWVASKMSERFGRLFCAAPALVAALVHAREGLVALGAIGEPAVSGVLVDIDSALKEAGIGE